MLGQHLAWHRLGDLLVVFKLALIVPQERRRNLPDGGPTTTLNKRSQHHGLVDVRHPHPMLDEVAERGEDQVCHAIAGFISGRSKPHASIRGSCHSILATSKSFNLPRGEL